MILLLLTGAAGMFVGARGAPPLDLFVVTMAGLGLACGGGLGAQPRPRPRHRPVDGEPDEEPSGGVRVRVSPAQALEFGLVLSALSFALLASAVNLLTATLALVGNLFYVVVYTRWLKRSTPQNIVIGEPLGACPARRLRSGHREPRPARALALPHRLPVDAAALLGARAGDDQEGVRGRGDPDAPGRARRPRDWPAVLPSRSASWRSPSPSGSGSARSTRPRP